MTSLVLVDDDGAVRTLTLNRPERLNAWTYELEAEYFARLDEADADPSVRAVIVTGAGRGFCAGLDLSVLSDRIRGIAADPGLIRPPMMSALRFRKPLIAAVNGACIGLGFVQAMCADVRFASEDAKFSTAYSRRGLPAEYGLSWMLPRFIGESRARELLISGRTFLGDEAAAIGLVHRALPTAELMDAVRRYAAEIAETTSPNAVAILKEQLADDWGRSREASESAFHEYQSSGRLAGDFAAGIRAVEEKAPPLFPDLTLRGTAPNQ